ncbi:MAG: S8 family serine peptidase [Acidobacteriaceae bacterium]|nr:S8 family serine peptidase [Acidobacteriaceae bacterium]
MLSSFCRVLFLSTIFTTTALSQQVSRLVVLYRAPQVPAIADIALAEAGARTHRHLGRLGASVFTVDEANEPWAVFRLSLQPEVLAVVHDRIVTGHAMTVSAAKATPHSTQDVTSLPVKVISANPPHQLAWMPAPVTDATYNSPAGWAVQAAGGYGDNVPGGNPVGPWNTTKGAGMRIAILDSGVDANHPDLVSNLALNMTEVDKTALPSACDDGSPQDQTGHGTWAASLAAGALGGGETVGVAPQATLLNIKVLERMPAAAGSTATAQCEAGQTGGLLSWVLAGINDALAQRADVISLSLGTIVDLTTGDGAGWKASFDRVTYAAQQAGVVIVAAAGNDGLDLSGGRYIELPAQARGVLAVVASTNPACVEDLSPTAICVKGPVTRPYYSNYGATLNAIAAPGGSYPEGPDNAVSGWIRGACSTGVTNTQDGLPSVGKSFGCFNLGHAQYVQAMGTSASAPLVAGAAALVKAAHPNWTATQIVNALQATATPSVSMQQSAINLPAALAFTPQ